MNFLPEVIYQLFAKEVSDHAELQTVGGGCIHQAGMFRFENDKYFVKWNHNASSMFETEAKGLKLLGSTSSLFVPEVIGHGTAGAVDYLCLAYVETGSAKNNFWQTFGASLAQLHQNTSITFGLDHDNYIGSLIQHNKVEGDWIKFFIDQRLTPQLKMAESKGLIEKQLISKFEILFSKLCELIPEERPALLHGDLWSGNFLVGIHGQPVIFDPAVYYGHREAEMAFTKLFGGFDLALYQTYQEIYPLQQGYEERTELFNLYPLLVHVNLFGSSYLDGIRRTLRRFA